MRKRRFTQPSGTATSLNSPRSGVDYPIGGAVPGYLPVNTLTPTVPLSVSADRFVELARTARDTVKYIRARNVKYNEGCTFRRLVEQVWEISWQSDLK